MSRLAIVFYFLMIAVLLVLTRIDVLVATFVPAKAVPPTTQAADALAIMKDVRSFYTDSWSMLLTYVTILIGFVGLVLPYLMKRDFRTEAEKLKAEILAEATSNISEATATLKAAAKQDASALRTRLLAEIYSAQSKPHMATAFHAQQSGHHDVAIMNLAWTVNTAARSHSPQAVTDAINFLDRAIEAHSEAAEFTCQRLASTVIPYVEQMDDYPEKQSDLAKLRNRCIKPSEQQG